MGIAEHMNAVAVLASISTALLGLVVYGARLIFQGRLVPRSTVEDVKSSCRDQVQREREIAEIQRAATIQMIEAFNTQSHQVERLVEGQETIRAFILSLPRPPQLTSGPGGNL
jgi:hypothetical protein